MNYWLNSYSGVSGHRNGSRTSPLLCANLHMHLVCPYCAHVTCSSTAHTENKAVVVKPHVYSLNMVLEKKSVVGQSGNSVGVS